MILHVTFSDGSNPWVSLTADRHTIAKQWRRWEKTHPNTAKAEIFHGDHRCRKSYYGSEWIVINNRGNALAKHYYKHLGHALAALERLGGAGK